MSTAGPVEVFVLQYVLNAAWLSTLIGAGTALVLVTLRGTHPRQRYRLAVAALVLCVVVPAIASAVATARSSALRVVVDTTSRAPLQVEAGLLIVPKTVANLILIAYVTTVVVRLLRLGFAAAQVRGLRQRATIITSGTLANRVAAHSAEWRLAPVSVALSDATQMPLLCGARSPLIILPASMASADPLILDVVLAHELAHAARRDVRANIALELAAVPLAGHPIAIFLKRLVRQSREQACDDAAIERLGVSRRHYAERLVEVARTWGTPMADAAVIGFGSRRSLENRVRAILTRPRRQSGGSVLTAVTAIATTIAIVIAVPRFTVTVGANGWKALAGVWQLDVARSRPAGMLPLRAAQLEIQVQERQIEVSQRRTTADGRRENVAFVAPIDRTAFNITMPTGLIVGARTYWSGTHLVTDAAVPGGATEHSEVSARGNELVIALVSRSPRGEMITDLVWRRVIGR
ncbi:MAG TPA: M56 family metallopeptidase [Vicinamibacterales bacterium]|nr:M56 family metallopeptidase [Vicinamibacterales bacterium]